MSLVTLFAITTSWLIVYAKPVPTVNVLLPVPIVSDVLLVVAYLSPIGPVAPVGPVGPTEPVLPTEPVAPVSYTHLTLPTKA